MSRAGNEFGGPAKERSGWLIPLAVFLVTAVLTGLVLLYYLSPTPSELIEEQEAPTGDETPVVSIGPQRFHIPAHYIPYASARKGGSLTEVKLKALLPDLQGYSSGEAGSFSWDSADSRLLELRLRARTILDARGRLDRIYLPQVENRDGTPGPYGLTQYSFRANSSYRDDELYVGESDGGLIVIRCAKAVSDSVAPACLREHPIAPGVALSYRYKRSHLANWREIDKSVRELLASFMTK